jgi:hypothetical protein
LAGQTGETPVPPDQHTATNYHVPARQVSDRTSPMRMA